MGSFLGACVWDPKTQAILRTIPGYPQHWVHQPCFFSPGGHLVAFIGPGLIRLCSLDNGRVLYTILNLRGDLHGVLSPEGHFSGSSGLEKELVYVVQTALGQETLTPEEFAGRYHWKNDPTKVQPGNAETVDAAPAKSESGKR